MEIKVDIKKLFKDKAIEWIIGTFIFGALSYACFSIVSLNSSIQKLNQSVDLLNRGLEKTDKKVSETRQVVGKILLKSENPELQDALPSLISKDNASTLFEGTIERIKKRMLEQSFGIYSEQEVLLDAQKPISLCIDVEEFGIKECEELGSNGKLAEKDRKEKDS